MNGLGQEGSDLAGAEVPAAPDRFENAPHSPVGQEGQAIAALQAAVTALAGGEAEQALVASSTACHAAPTWPEAHYVYGQAWSALGVHATAERAFAEAVRLRPVWADAWVNFGVARYRQGAIDDATTAMRQALRVEPGHAAAMTNLGAFLRLTGAPDAAEALLRAALARNPEQFGARLNLVADLLQEERAAEALALLDETQVPQDAQAARHWHLQRALALVTLGRPVEARAALAACDALGPLPADLRPLHHWRWVLIALAEGDRPRAEAEARAMEASLDSMGPAAVLEHRIMAHYDLAKFWSQTNEASRAFAHWQAGHKILKTLQPFSRAAAQAFTDASIATFTAKRLTKRRAKNSDAAPVFIVGMPRSGTTLCEQILAAHPEAYGAGERSALGQVFQHLTGGETPEGLTRIKSVPAETFDRVAEAYLAALHALAPDKARIIDKMPGNYRYLGLVSRLFPRATIIHCTRDPRDIGLSIFTFRFHGAHGYAHDLGDLGWAIADQERLMAHWKTVLPNPILTVRLADWVYDFDATLARVLAHVGLRPNDACARFYETESRVRTVSRAQVRQPVNARGLGRWRAYEQELQPLIAELDRAGVLEAWIAEHAPAGAALDATR